MGTLLKENAFLLYLSRWFPVQQLFKLGKQLNKLNSSNMKTILTFAVVLLFASQISGSNLLAIAADPGSGVASLIETANKSGKAVFLVVFDKAGADKDKAVAIAK